MAWLLQSFELMSLPDVSLAEAMLVHDRFYANLDVSDVGRYSPEAVLLGFVLLALKAGSMPADELNRSVGDLVVYMGSDTVAFEEIVYAELLILDKLRFCVCAPSPREFLQTLILRPRCLLARAAADADDVTNGEERLVSLTEYIVELIVVEPQVYHGHPYFLVAAAVLALALASIGAPDIVYEALLEDLHLHCRDRVEDPLERQVLIVGAAIHQLWMQAWHIFDTGQVPASKYLRHLAQKFRRSAVLLEPPPLPPSALMRPCCMVGRLGG